MKRIRWSFLSLLFLALPLSTAFAQTRRVSGTVRAESGEPLVAASVGVVGTALGTYTDDQGRFTLNVTGPVTLRVRRIGYTQKTVDVGPAATDVAVVLTRDVLQLETQVVTGTATTVSSRNAANAVAVVSGEQLNRAPTPTIENALQGKIPGAVITTNSGAPGGGAQVQLRGVTSIGANSSPLYVVDGVIVSNDAISSGLTTITQASRVIGTSNQDQQVNRIADLNPADIEDISVLKGASASSIYGSAASNGVILITTKRGRNGKPAFNVTQRFGQFRLSNKLNIRCFTSAQEAADAGLDATPFSPECRDVQEEFYGQHDLSYETDVSVSGGNGGTSYFASGLVKRDAGLEIGTGYNKQSLRLNLGQSVGTRLKLQANTQLVHSLTARGISGNDNANVNPYTVFSATPSFFNYNRDPVTGVYPANPYLGRFGDNPFQDRDLLSTPENVYRLIGGASANYNLLSSSRQNLEVIFSGGVDQFSQNDKLVSPASLYFEPADGLPGTVVDNNSSEITGTLYGSLVHRFFPSSQLFNATTSVGFRQGRKQFGQVFTAGQNLLLGQANLDKAANITAFETRTLVKDFSYYGQEELLLLNEKLLLTAGANLERGSTNGDPDKFFAYPKAAASFSLPWRPRGVDNLKLRAAYGRAGNKPQFGQAFTPLVVIVENNILGTRPALNAGLSTIKPERSSETEAGFDATLFGGRASLEFTGYRKGIDDLILTATRAPSTGFTTQVVQGGSLINRGYEFALNMTPVQRGGVNWISRTTFSHNHAIVTQLPVPAFNTGGFGLGFGATRIEVGKSPTAIIGRNGRDTTFRDASGNLVTRGTGACPAAPTTVSCGTFVKRADHLEIIGDASPRFTMGFSNEFNFGPVRITSLVDWRHGGDVANLTNDYLLDCCSDNQGTLGDTVLVNKIRAKQALRQSRAFVENASFVKLRELSLSYAVPHAFVKHAFGSASAVRVELSGRNLLTKTPYTGLDPEVSNFGNTNVTRYFDVTPYPPSRSFFFSVSADF
ncbi:MAG: SusC/RagA family TonB-linked outer membrane protein [Gemmatimonadaceae bacterium]|nr:SusC/RagA family TonB-linked outer membrane protein [Gemmatimonadaceae bacterium]